MGFFGRWTRQLHPRRGVFGLRTFFTLLLVAASSMLLQAQSPNYPTPEGQQYPEQAYPSTDQQDNPYTAQGQYPQQQGGYGQQYPASPEQPYAAPQQAQPYPAYGSQQAPPQNAAPVSFEQLKDLVAPIALFPDPLLGEVLAASTYPMEVAQAEQWVRDHNGWQTAVLLDAAKQQNWDASVQGLVAFPSVLAQLTQNMSWTTALGNAFLAQQADVMQAVQVMRQQAQARGTLRSTPQETVSDEYQNGQPYVAIEPASPDVIYVPEYNPVYVWGTPAWGYYPAVYYPAGAGLFWSTGINFSLCFGHFGWGGWGGWGWRPNWYGHSLWVNGAFFHRYGFHDYGFRGGAWGGRSVWMHSPDHRWGVPYGNRSVAARYGQSSYNNGYRAGVYSHGGYNGSYNHGGFNNGYNQGTYSAPGHSSYGNYGSYNRSSYVQAGHYNNGFGNQHAFAGNYRSNFNGGYQAGAVPRVPSNHFASGSSASSVSYGHGYGQGYSGFHGGGATHPSGGNSGFHESSHGGGGGFHSSGGGGGFHGGGGGGHGGGGRR